MKSLCAILALFSLLLFAKTIESRRDVGKYWKNVMKEQPMPQAIEGLLVDISDSTPKQKADCHEKVKKPFVEVEEFEPRPNVSSYNDDETKASLSSKDNAGPKAKQSFAAKEDKQPFEEDFEPRPNVSVYNE
ncbi:organ-specific protein S2 [Prunus yedoensis var. nudiflora]|uniref:Organ-specific protein S2 n=1 Tax=Prunus yedoensis var. nudiflora TaxID=2094558 RepID=A0A314Z2J6_PRUYE|nr:organ-specific protein S2 [Prunus yedoensis var. nudiflora]